MEVAMENKYLDNCTAIDTGLDGISFFRCIIKAGEAVTPRPDAEELIVLLFNGNSAFIQTRKDIFNITEPSVFIPDFDRSPYTIQAIEDLEFMMCVFTMNEWDKAFFKGWNLHLPFFSKYSDGVRFNYMGRSKRLGSWRIVISIAICFKTGINMGLIAMTFAFLIGCLFMGEKAASIFGFWPDSLIFFLLASAMFYGFARENGTLTLFGTKLLYKFRKSIEALPFVFAFIAFVLGLLGAGPGTIVLLAPLGFSVCAQTGIDPLLMVFAIDTGYNCGTQNPWTGTGVVLYGLVEESGVAADIAIHTYMLSYTTFLINKVLFLVLFYVGFKFLKGKKNAGTQKVQNLDILEKEPEQFSKIQKKTMILILVSFCLLVIPNIINTLVKIKDPAFKNLVALCKPQAVLIIFALIASFMNLANPKKVF